MRIAERNACLALGQHLAIRIASGSTAMRYVNVFEVGFFREVALMSDDASGTELEPGHATIVREDPGTGKLLGFEVEWHPDGLPRDGPRTVSVMVVVTTKPADLRALEHNANLSARAMMTSLEELFEQAATGRTRGDAAAGSLATTPFAIQWLDFLVVPLKGTTNFGVRSSTMLSQGWWSQPARGPR